MLVEFSVENYRSFKEKVTFSMLASDDTSHEDANVITLPDGKRLLKSAAIYGANASGKSNLIKAMDFMSSFVYTSHQKRPDDRIQVEPFKLDATCLDKPSKFDIIFYCNNVKYAYGFSATTRDVIEEYLYSFQDGNDDEQIIFSRNSAIDPEYEFAQGEDTVLLKHLCQFNGNNKLYLSTAFIFNYPKVVDAYKWICDLNSYNFNSPYNILHTGYFDKDADEEKLQGARVHVNKAIQWVKEIDVAISDVQINENPDLFKDDFTFNNDNWERYLKIQNNIETTHEVHNPDGTRTQFVLNFYNNESAGTKWFFSIALYFAERMSRAGIFIADELNISLHTLLAKHIVSLFHSTISNPLCSQLIFTTHDTNLLDLDLLRRDQIWFLEKNPDVGGTSMFSLCEFDVDENSEKAFANIEKGYLLGIYGAIPFVGGAING